MRERTRLNAHFVRTERQPPFPFEEKQVGRVRGCVSRQLLARGEAENNDLHVIVIVQRAAEDALFRHLDFFRQGWTEEVFHTLLVPLQPHAWVVSPSSSVKSH